MGSFEEELDEFLQHWDRPHYDPRKAHEYYMRTRKLMGKTIKKTEDVAKVGAQKVEVGAKRVEKFAGDHHDNQQEKNAKLLKNLDRQTRDYVDEHQRPGQLDRLDAQQHKVDVARQKAKDLAPSKRKEVEKKLNALEKKLKNARKKFDNPFNNKHNKSQNSRKPGSETVTVTRHRFRPDTVTRTPK